MEGNHNSRAGNGSLGEGDIRASSLDESPAESQGVPAVELSDLPGNPPVNGAHTPGKLSPLQSVKVLSPRTIPFSPSNGIVPTLQSLDSIPLGKSPRSPDKVSPIDTQSLKNPQSQVKYEVKDDSAQKFKMNGVDDSVEAWERLQPTCDMKDSHTNGNGAAEPQPDHKNEEESSSQRGEEDEGEGEEEEELTPRSAARYKHACMMWQRGFHGVVQDLQIQKAKELAMARYGTVEDKPKGNPWIISNDSDFRVAWDLTQVLVLLYVALVVPFRVCFAVEIEGPPLWVDMMVDLYFVLDILVNFSSEVRLEVDMEVQIIDNHKGIALNYLRGWFALDIVACLPLDYVTRSEEGSMKCSLEPDGCGPADGEGGGAGGALKLLKLLRVFRLLKLVRLVRITRILQRYEHRLVYWQHVLAVVKVIGVTTMFSHWMGCFYGMVFEWDASETEWTLMEKWVVCFYWATQTTTTVGYGDHTSSTIKGQLVSVIAMIVGGVIFSWFMSSIFAVLNPDPKKQEIQQTMQYVVQYLQTNKLPAETAGRVLAFYKKNNKFHFDDKQLLDTLPLVLQQEIFELLYARTLRTNPIFLETTDEIVIEFCMLVNPIVVPQYEMCYQPGDPSEDLFMLASGEVVVCYGDMSMHIKQGVLMNPAWSAENAKLKIELEGTIFGEEGLFACKKRLELAFVKSPLAKLLKVNVEELMKLLNKHSTLKQACQMGFMQRLVTYGSQDAQRSFLRQSGLVRELMDDATGCIVLNWKNVVQDKQRDPWNLGGGVSDLRKSLMAPSMKRRQSVMNPMTEDGDGASPSENTMRNVSFGKGNDGGDPAMSKKIDLLTNVVYEMRDHIKKLETELSAISKNLQTPP